MIPRRNYLRSCRQTFMIGLPTPSAYLLLSVLAYCIALLWKSGPFIVAQEPPLDVIYLKNGHSFQGVILQETGDSMHFRQVIRLPGKPTYILDAVFFPDEIARVQRTDEASRQQWVKKLEKLDPRGIQEKKRMAALFLAKLPGGPWSYRGPWFSLVSHLSSEELTRRVIVRLEDVFEAFREYFGERHIPNKSLSVQLYINPAHYRQALKERGLTLFNPAIYIPERAEILVFTDWEELAATYQQILTKHEAQLRELDRYEAQLRQHYFGQPPPAALEKVRVARLQLARINRENEAIFERQVQPLFRLCYHESFHAYLDLYLFPNAHQSVPRWFNEGLAQIFETAIVETGDIRIGHIDGERLRKVQTMLKQGEMPALRAILESEARHFQVNHHSDNYVSDRYFLASWAAAYYLLFGPHHPPASKIGTPGERLRQLLEELANTSDPKKVLETYTSRTWENLEQDWQLYFLRLRPDGTLRPREEIRPQVPGKGE
ncbi:hypothetical protein HRbin36_01645 [bacterium HR36]|nr:hypothetical protein HRbin36_01645 [bacterium HR36]